MGEAASGAAVIGTVLFPSSHVTPLWFTATSSGRTFPVCVSIDALQRPALSMPYAATEVICWLASGVGTMPTATVIASEVAMSRPMPV